MHPGKFKSQPPFPCSAAFDGRSRHGCASISPPRAEEKSSTDWKNDLQTCGEGRKSQKGPRRSEAKYQMANFKIVIYACAFLFAVGCAHHGDVQNAPDLSERNVVLGQVLQPALIAFSALKEKGALPGLGADEHGSLDAFPSDGKGTNSSYPQSVTIRVEKENAVEWFYFYTLQKSSKQSDWLLAKAWKQEKLSGKKINLKNDKILPP